MLDRVRAGPKRQLDAVGAMGVNRNLAPIGMGGLDQRHGLVIEQADGKAGAAVDAASGGELDDVRAAVDLTADGTAAAFDAVTEVFGTRIPVRNQVVVERTAPVHVTAGG